MSKRFKRLATEAGVPVVKLNEGGRHTGNSLMYDAEIRPDLVMRRVGHAMWGGWGSNPRPADYEKYGFVHHAR